MNINGRQPNWECAANHLPAWSEELSVELSAVISKEDYNRVIGLLDRYNELTDVEEKQSNDGHFIYGIENEKQEIIDAIIKIQEKYKQAAIELRDKLKQ